jgi:hypothetical protein
VRHAMIGRVVAVPRILRDVWTSYSTGPFERRLEDGRVPWHGKLREPLSRHAGNGVERVGFAFLVDDVVEERAEFCRPMHFEETRGMKAIWTGSPDVADRRDLACPRWNNFRAGRIAYYSALQPNHSKQPTSTKFPRRNCYGS